MTWTFLRYSSRNPPRCRGLIQPNQLAGDFGATSAGNPEAEGAADTDSDDDGPPPLEDVEPAK